MGIAGAPTTLNGDVVGVRTPPKLNECVLQASTPDMFLGVDAIAFRKVVASAKNVVYGGDAYSYALLASGCADVVVEADLKVWDFMALVPVLQGAGAVIGDWMGFPLGLESDGRVVAAASSTLFTEVTDLIGALDELNLSPESSFVSRPFLTKDVLPDDPGLGHVESMTGFGMSVVETEGYTITAQIRSVNSRYCTVQVRGPKCILPFESSIVAIIKKAAVRGKILANLEIVSSPSDIDAIPVVVDRAAVKAARKMLDTIAQEAGIDEKPHLADIMNFSEVLTKLDEDSMVKVALQVTIQAVSEAVENMREARRREGAILEADLMARTRKIQHVLDEIESRLPARVVSERNRIKKLLDGFNGLDSTRLEAEITLFADRVDVTEELVRLRAHVQLFEMTFLGVHEPIGKRLGFLLQEIHREITTLCNKSYDAPVMHLCMLIKEEVEKIREQCLNIR